MNAQVDPLPTIEALVPHRPPMLLLDSVDSYGRGWIKAKVFIREDSAFVVDANLPPIVLLEYMAQAVAAYSGLESSGAPRVGYLVGVRQLDIAVDTIPTSQLLHITARRIWSNQVSGSFNCQVQAGAAFLARARLSVFHPAVNQGAQA